MNARAVVVAGLLVLTAVAGPGVGGAAAANNSTTSDTCGFLDGLMYSVYMVGANNPQGAADNPCNPVYQAGKTIEDINQNQNATNNVTTYNRLTDQRKSIDDYLTLQDNYLQDTRMAAMAKAESAAVEAIENGANRSETKAAARQAVNDYYAKKQINLVKRWNSAVEKMWTIRNMSANHGAGPWSTLSIIKTTPKSENYTYGGSGTYSVVQSDAVLVNGSTVSQKGVQYQGSMYVDDKDTGSGTSNPSMTVTLTLRSPGVLDEFYGYKVVGWKADNVGTNPSKTVTTYKEWNSTWNDVSAQSSQVSDSGAAYGATVYDNVVSGNGTASSYLSPLALAKEYGVNGSAGGHYSQSLAALSGVGWSTPDMDTTGMMTISFNGSTYEGFVASTQTPDQGWETGETYYTASLNGSELLVTKNNGTMQMQGSFTVDSIEATDGSQVNSTRTVQIKYQTINNSDYVALQEQIRNLSAQYEAREPTAGGGSQPVSDDDGFNWSNNTMLVAGVAALLVIGSTIILVSMR